MSVWLKRGILNAVLGRAHDWMMRSKDVKTKEKSQTRILEILLVFNVIRI